MANQKLNTCYKLKPLPPAETQESEFIKNRIPPNSQTTTTTTNTVIHYVPNHPIEHKKCSVQILSMTITYIATNPRRKGRKAVKQITKSNRNPLQVIDHINWYYSNILTSQQNNSVGNEKQRWVTFTYYSLLIRKVKNIFKDMLIQIAFKHTNTTSHLTKVWDSTCNEFEKMEFTN